MKRVKGKMTDEQKARMKREAAAADKQKPRLQQLTRQASSKLLQCVVSEEIYEAFKQYSEEHQTPISDVLREGGLKYIGRPELLSTMRQRGRPRTSEKGSS